MGRSIKPYCLLYTPATCKLLAAMVGWMRNCRFSLLCFSLLLVQVPSGFGYPLVQEASIGITGTVTLPYNFTLAAYNTTLPNHDKNGAPLVLGQNGATSGVTPHVTSTRASFPYDDYPTLGLINGSLRAYSSDGSWNTNATQVRSGSTLGWVTTTRFATPAPEIYSAVTVPLAKYPLLAAFGHHDLWSLCPFPGRLGQTNVVYDVAAATNGGFDPQRCYAVILFIIRV
ncbi:hypothetical protein NP233_g1125 [Leucocoprinus birnbaumii]|uniref:Uncharacterized protein n=1 Tax=Leucocoprinus birnbaumii TaxID=56174 RepID=A0AAD5W2V9_9AGAR|nr:hypothetical protein NP233_g1125 [Leucocoprinus birnbaumii]